MWIINDLTTEDGNHWFGSIPNNENIEFFIQVLDNAGNVAVADNKGAYYDLNVGIHKIYLPVILK